MGLKFFKEASQRAAQAQALAAQNKKKKEDEERRKRNEQAKKRAEQKKKQQQQKSTLSKPTADTYKFDGNLKKYDGKVNTGNIKLSAPVVKQSVIQNEPVIQQKNSTVKDIASGIGRQLWGGYGKWAEGVNKAAYHGVKYIPGVGSAFKKAIDNQEAYNKANLEKGAEKIQKHLGNGFKSAAVNSLSQSAGQMIPDIVTTFMSAGTNRAASLAKLTADSGVSKWVKALKLPKESTPLFLSNLGNAYDDAIKNGANDGQALTSALINAYPQTVIEHSGGIQDLIKGKSKENVLKSIITSAIDEGKEELLQYPFEELSKLPYAPVTPYSSDPNEQAVINPKAQAQAAAVGALGGLVFGGVNTAFEGAANVAGKTVTGAKLKDFKQDIIDEGLNSPDGTYANDNALKLDNKKHVSLYDIGKQYELNVQQQENYKDGKYHTIPYNQPRKTIVPPSTEAEYKTQEKTVKKPVSTEFEGEVKEQQYEKTQQTVNVQAPIPDVRNASAVNGFPNDGVSQNSHDVNRAFTEFEALERAKYNETAKIKAVTPIYMQAKTLNSSQKRLVEDCRTLGIPVTFIEGTRVQTRGSSLNGAYYNGNIFINTSSENPYTVVAAHEVLHRIKDTDPEAYSQLCGIVDDALGKDNDFSGLGDYEKEEALADIMGDIIGEPKKYREVFRQKQNLLQRVIGYIRDMIARLTGKISGNFKNVSEFTESLKDAESKLTQIYKEAADKMGSFEGEIKYSDSQQHIYDYTKSFAEQVEDYRNGKIPEYDSLLLGGTPDVFKKLGFNSLPVTINQRHVDYALNGTKDIDHHIGEAMLSQLPEAIKDPVAVMRSQTKPNRLVALLEFTYNGRNLFAPFEIDGYGRQNSIRIDSNAIVSVYAKDNAISKQLKKAIQDEATGKISLFYLNKNKADVLLQRAGLQLPGGLFQNNGFIHSIREKGANVNTRFENVTETQQFKRWFGDWQNNPKKASKVVNDDGTPKVVYHGSANKFTKFDYGKIGTSSGVKILGDGFYFSDNSGLAKGYGDNIYECYIDIKKPYYATEQDLYKIDVARLERLGYDGVILNTPKGEVYSVFNPNQIKSATDNIGTFDKNNPDIRYSKKAEAESDTKGETDDYLWHIDSNGKFNFKDGERHIGNYIYPNEAMLTKQDFKLADVLTTYSVPADKFAHLSDTKVVFDENSDSDTGYYDPKTDTIHLAKNDNNFEKNSELILRYVEDIVNGGEKSRVLRGTQGSNGASSTERSSDFGNSVPQNNPNVNDNHSQTTDTRSEEEKRLTPGFNRQIVKITKTNDEGEGVRYHFDIDSPNIKKLRKTPEYKSLIAHAPEYNDKSGTNQTAHRTFKSVFGKQYDNFRNLIYGNIDKTKMQYNYLMEFWTNSLKKNIIDKGILKDSTLSQIVRSYGERNIVGSDWAEVWSKKFSALSPSEKQKVKAADKWFRTAYDSLIDGINESRSKTYPNVEKVIQKYEDTLAKLNSDIDLLELGEVESVFSQAKNRTYSRINELQSIRNNITKNALKTLEDIDADIKTTQSVMNLKKNKDTSVYFNLQKRLETLNARKEKIQELFKSSVETKNKRISELLGEFSTADEMKAADISLKLEELKNRREMIEEKLDDESLWRGKRIPKRKDYYRHIQEMSLSGGIRNLFGMPANIATELVGLSEFTKPKSKFTTIGLKRNGTTTTTDAVSGFIDYLPQAAYAMTIDQNIEVIRGLRDDLTKATSDTKNMNRVLQRLDFLANEFAGKTVSQVDRLIQDKIGRTAFRGINKLVGARKAAVVVGNMRSGVAQIGNLPNVIASIENPLYFFKSLAMGVKNDLQNDSPFLKERFSDYTSQFDTGIFKYPSKFTNALLSFGDEFVARLGWNAAYSEGIHKRVNNPVRYADDIIRNAVGGRGIGERSLLQQSKIMTALMPFSLETSNSLQFQIDLAKRVGNSIKGKKAKELLKSAWGFVLLYFSTAILEEFMERTTGSGMGMFNPVGIIHDNVSDSEKSTSEKIKNIAKELPGNFIGSTAMGQQFMELYPEKGMKFYGNFKTPKREDLFGDENPTKFGTSNLISSGLKEPLTAFIPGGSQISKTVKGIKTVNDGVVTSKNGKVQYAVGKTPANYIRATLFGKSALPEARRYYSGNSKPFSDKDTEEYNKRVANGESNLKVYADINERRKAKDAAEMVNPFIKNSANPSNIGIYKELGRLKQSGKNVEFEAPDTEFEVDGKTVKLDSYKYARYAREAATTAEKETANLFKSKHYAPIDDKEKVLSEVYSYAKALAKTKVSNYTLTPEHQKIKLATENGISAGEFIAIKQAMGDGSKSVSKVFDFARKNGYGEQESEKLINLMTLTTDEYKRLYQRDGFKSGYRMHLLYYRAKQNGIDAKTCFVPIAKEDFSITDKKAGIKFSTTLNDKEISELQIVYNYYYEGALKSLDKMKFNNVQELYTATQKIRNKMLKAAKRDYYYYLKRTRQG